MEQCPNCSQPLEDPDSNFCTKCGFPLKKDASLPNPIPQAAVNPNSGTIPNSPLQFQCLVCGTPYILQRRVPKCQVCGLKFLYDINGNIATSMKIYYRTLGPQYMDSIIRNYTLEKNRVPLNDLKSDLKGSADERFQHYRKELLNSGTRKLGVGSGLLLPLLATIIIAIFVAISLIFTGLSSDILTIGVIFTWF
jgi:predicted amidophosphoribosyltransferase